MIKECVLFSKGFKPKKEFKEFLESIYESPFTIEGNSEIMFDPKVVEFVKNNQTDKFRGENVYKGESTFMMKIGFSGFCYVTKVDTDKTWILGYDIVDKPFIRYVEPIFEISKYGCVTMGLREVKDNEN